MSSTPGPASFPSQTREGRALSMKPDNDKVAVVALLVLSVLLWALGFLYGFMPGNE